MHQKLGGWENGLLPQTIDRFRQNTPELIVRDMRRLLSLSDEQCETVRKILLARGVNKWLKARRDLIDLKNEIKFGIIHLNSHYEKGNLVHRASIRLLNYFRQELRSICHQSRWVEWPNVASPKKAEKSIVVKNKRGDVISTDRKNDGIFAALKLKSED